MQRAAVFNLDAERHRPAAHLAVLDVLLCARTHLDARLEALTAVRTAGSNELLGCNSRALRRRVVHGLQSIQLVYLARIRACEPACQGFNCRNLATCHAQSFYTPVEFHVRRDPGRGTAVNPARPRQRLLACTFLCAALSACGGAGRLGADAPGKVNLGGTWKLNRAQSDDPYKIYDKIRRERAERYGEQAPPPPPARSGGQGQGPNSGANPGVDPLIAEQRATAAAIASSSHLD